MHKGGGGIYVSETFLVFHKSFEYSFEILGVHPNHIQNILWAEELQQILSLLFSWENGPEDRHFEACHADEHEIASLPQKSKKSSEKRNKTCEKLKNLKDFQQNINVLTKKSGTLIIEKHQVERKPKIYNFPAVLGLFGYFSVIRTLEALQIINFQGESVHHAHLSGEKPTTNSFPLVLY